MKENIHVFVVPLPLKVKGFSVPDADGFSVYLNANLSYEQNKITYNHELQHILNDDHYSISPVGLLECAAHG